MHNACHTLDNKSDKINFKGLEQVSKYAFELGWKIVNANMALRFNYTAFKEMPYDHDHGHPMNSFLHWKERK
jgi:hypothetical protein